MLFLMESFGISIIPFGRSLNILQNPPLTIGHFPVFCNTNHIDFFLGRLTCTSGGAVVSASRRQSIARLASPSTLQ